MEIISNTNTATFIKSVDSLKQKLETITLEPILQNIYAKVGKDETQDAEDIYKIIKTTGSKISHFPLEEFYLVCLSEILENQNLFAIPSKDFIPTEPIKTFLKIQTVGSYILNRFDEKFFNPNKGKLELKMRISNINMALLVQKNHYLLASSSNSTYLHDFTLLKKVKELDFTNALTKVIEEILNGHTGNQQG